MRSRITAVAASRIRLTSPALVALLGAGAIAACSPAAAKTASGATDSAAVPVVAHPVSLAARAWATTASGIVQANSTVDVAFQVPGKVVSVGPDEGQSVRVGQTIASVDPTEYKLAVEQAAAQSDRAAHDRDRNQPLLASGAIAPADMDHLASGARQSAAAADLAKKRLADTRIDAPISGIISRRSVEVGTTVAAGQAVYTIVDLDPVRIRLGVPEADVGHITEGAAATVRIPALDTSFTGRVTLIGVAAEPTTRSYTVEISVPNPARKLRAGMVAEATITTRQTRTAMMVPAPAVVHDGGVNGTTIVYVLDRDGARAHSRRVTTGGARGDSLEITSGAQAGDLIVVAGQQRLRDGARVQQVQSTAQAGGVKP
jgi:RND family efflux transporter MFP subunit